MLTLGYTKQFKVQNCLFLKSTLEKKKADYT